MVVVETAEAAAVAEETEAEWVVMEEETVEAEEAEIAKSTRLARALFFLEKGSFSIDKTTARDRAIMLKIVCIQTTNHVLEIFKIFEFDSDVYVLSRLFARYFFFNKSFRFHNPRRRAIK